MRKIILKPMPLILLIFLSVGSKTLGSQLLHKTLQDHKDNLFLEAVSVGNAPLAVTYLLHGANANTQNTAGESAFMIAQRCGFSGLQGTIMSYGGYLPLSVVKVQMQRGTLKWHELEQFLRLSTIRIRKQNGFLKNPDFLYLTKLKDCYKWHKHGKK